MHFRISAFHKCFRSTVGLKNKILLLLAVSCTSCFILNLLSNNLQYNKLKIEESTKLPCANILSDLMSLDSIPPIVHWTSKDGKIHSKLVKLVQTWTLLLHVNISGYTDASTNPPDVRLISVPGETQQASSNADASAAVHLRPDRWHFMHWDDNQISELISKHYPKLSRTYSKLVNGLERSDIGRLVVLHHVGGLYVDTDVELLRDPSPLLRPSGLRGAGLSANFSCQSAVWSQELPEHAAFPFNRQTLLSNAVMMSRANHSFLSFVLEHWPPWFEQHWAKKTGRVHNDAVFVTGPVMLQSFYDKYTALAPSERPADWCGNILAEADAFQPLWDVANLPYIIAKACAEPSKLSELQKRHCGTINMKMFQEKQVPNSSYALHKYMHLSYKKMDMVGSCRISSILPIISCSI